ncbi:MAG: leucine-rich repeat domain-containing protein [Oscillospiraceae bacterium]|jgi:Leucine-rich repeat (LRR) protein|nr:leucine-rich repeat domain-containing protein [Oscillospiraceae bacterium]
MKKKIIAAIPAICLVAALLSACDGGIVNDAGTSVSEAALSPSVETPTMSSDEIVGEIKEALRGDDYRLALDHAETDAFTALIKSGGYISGDGFGAELDSNGELTVAYFDIVGGGDIGSLNGTEYFMRRMDIAYNGGPAVALKCGKSDVSDGHYTGKYEEYWHIAGDWKLVSSWIGYVVNGGFEGEVSYYGANSGTATERYESGYDGVNMNPEDRMPFPEGEDRPDLGSLDPSLVIPTSAWIENVDYITIKGKQYSTSLTNLHIASMDLTDADINPLRYMNKLIWLSLGDNQITDLGSLAGLTNLIELRLYHNQLSDIRPLTGLTSLTKLNLFGNQISDIKPLTGLTNLMFLSLHDNQITDVNPLAGLTNLTELRLQNNPITDIKPLAGLIYLSDLFLDNNQITNIEPLAGLINLNYLRLSYNQISDIEPLAGLIYLNCLEMDGNQISDLTPLSKLTSMTSLLLSHNKISDITPIGKLTSLTQLDLRFNGIRYISPLAELDSLSHALLAGNAITDWSPVAHVENVNGRPEQ